MSSSPLRSTRLVLFPALALALVLAPAAHGDETWTPLGPDGGSVSALALDAHAGSLYAGTRAGVFKSTDGGGSWNPAGGELPGGTAGGAWVRALAVEPGRPDVVYASVLLEGIFRSDDGGATWRDADAGLVGTHADVLIPHPRFAGTVYAATTAGLFRSTNSGGLWTKLPRFPTTVSSVDVTALALDPAATQTLYAGVTEGLVRTVNGGATWTHVGTSALGGSRIDALAVHPTSGAVYAATARFAEGTTGLWRSTDGGATWVSASQGLPAGKRITTLAILPAPPHALLAGVLGAGVYKSIDGGAQWFAASPALTQVAVLVPDPEAGDTIYAAAEGLGTAGVFKSGDAGGSWTPKSRGIRGFELEALVVDAQTPSTLYLASSSLGVLKSTDSGQSWVAVNQGLGPPGQPVGIFALAIDRGDPRVLYASTSWGLFKTRDRGLLWTEVAMPNHQVPFHLDIDPQHPGVLHAAGSLDGLFRSEDGGASWVHVAGGDPWGLRYLTVTDLVRHPAAPAVLYAGTAYTGWPEGYTEPGLFKSVDRGANWTRIAAGSYYVLAVDPRAPSTLYALGDSNAVLKSTDGGADWTQVGTAPAPGHVLLVDPFLPTTLYLAHGAGVLRSDDGGATWETWTDGLRHLGVSDLVLDPATGRIYVTTRGGGLSTRLATSPAPCIPDATALCLQDGRFRVEVSWKDFAGNTGVGRTLHLTGDTGAFWFFDDDNLELTVKVLDGTGLNGKHWVFYGSLTSVEFSLTVTDTLTLRQKTYRNPPGTMASVGDTAAF